MAKISVLGAGSWGTALSMWQFLQFLRLIPEVPASVWRLL